MPKRASSQGGANTRRARFRARTEQAKQRPAPASTFGAVEDEVISTQPPSNQGEQNPRTAADAIHPQDELTPG